MRRAGVPTSPDGETLRPQGQKKLGYIPFPADEAKPHAAQASPPRRTATPLPKAAMIAPPSPNSPPCNIPVIPAVIGLSQIPQFPINPRQFYTKP